MVRIISVSGKDGSGKTTVAINLSLALLKLRKRTALIDFNLMNSSADLYFDARPSRTLNDYLRDRSTIDDTVYRHDSGLDIIFSTWLMHNKEGPFITRERESVASGIKGKFSRHDFVVVDSSPGFGDQYALSLEACTDVLLVSSPYISHAAEAAKYAEFAKEANNRPRVIGVVMNFIRKKDYELTAKDVSRLTGMPVIGAIPEDESVRKSTNARKPLLMDYPESKAANAFYGIAARLAGTGGFL